jgi:hypothetical protein
MELSVRLDRSFILQYFRPKPRLRRYRRFVSTNAATTRRTVCNRKTRFDYLITMGVGRRGKTRQPKIMQSFLSIQAIEYVRIARVNVPPHGKLAIAGQLEYECKLICPSPTGRTSDSQHCSLSSATRNGCQSPQSHS